MHRQGWDIPPDEDRHISNGSITTLNDISPDERLRTHDLEEDSGATLALNATPFRISRPPRHIQEPIDTSSFTESDVYQRVLNSRPIPAVNDYYRSEQTRLRTFIDWPPRANVRKEDLARNGFYYTGTSDKVRTEYSYTIFIFSEPLYTYISTE